MVDPSLSEADVRALQSDKSRFQAMLEQSPDVVVIADDSGRITYISPSVEMVLGYPAEQFMDQVWDIIHPDDREESRDMSARARSNPGELVRGRRVTSTPTAAGSRWTSSSSTCCTTPSCRAC